MEMNDGPSGRENTRDLTNFSSAEMDYKSTQGFDRILSKIAFPNPSNIKKRIWGNLLWNCQESQSIEHPPLGKIHDIHQQVWILLNGTLIATPYEENVNPVTLEILPCRDESLPKDKGQPIYLGIKASGLCLCCAMSGEQPTLQLVLCQTKRSQNPRASRMKEMLEAMMEEKNIADLYKTPEAVKPFVFYLNQTGSTSTLESAAYSGWFIGTSSDKNQPVTLTQNLGSQYNTDFFLEIENPKLEPHVSA